MKITKSQLKQIIKEETEALMEAHPQQDELLMIYGTLKDELPALVNKHFGTKALGGMLWTCILALADGNSVGPMTPDQKEGLNRDLLGLSNTGGMVDDAGNETRREMPRWKGR